MSDPQRDFDEHAAEMTAVDAELHVAAAGFVEHFPWPKWYLDALEAHRAENGRLIERGHLAAAAVFEAHGPMLDGDSDEGYFIACCGQDHPDDEDVLNDVYPCAALKAVHDGAGLWDHLIREQERALVEDWPDPEYRPRLP